MKHSCGILCFVLLCVLFFCSSCTDASNRTHKNNKSAYSVKLSADKIYAKCNPAVFSVVMSNSMFQSQGSGFFISSSGLAVSNYHVFEGNIRGLEQIITSSGKTYKVSRVIDFNKADDYIIFKVKTEGQKVRFLPISNKKLRVGQTVYAIGSPRGFDNTLSSGEISQLRGDNHSIIQINAPIDHGSSGGALINEYGEVIGITSSGIDNSIANINFAINMNVLKPSLDKIKKKHHKKRKFKSHKGISVK